MTKDENLVCTLARLVTEAEALADGKSSVEIDEGRGPAWKMQVQDFQYVYNTAIHTIIGGSA